MNHFDFAIKGLDPLGEIEGLASTYNNVDRQCDVVMPGAFQKWLAATGGKVPLLWQHDQARPIGLAQLTDGAAGLRVKGQLDLESPDGRLAYSAVKKEYVTAFSIGYKVAKSSMLGAVRQLKELTVWEVSLATIPANAAALITGVKDAGDDDDRELAVAMSTTVDALAELNMRILIQRLRSFAHTARTS